MFSFSVLFSVIVLSSVESAVESATSLTADTIYKPNYGDFVAFEGKTNKDRDRKNNKKLKKKILLVDDEPDLTFSFEEALEDAGFNVDVFNDSIHALENFKPDFYDLVILDIVMPEMGGFDLYTELKKLDPRINVCFLTAGEQYHKDHREAKHRILAQDLFIQKPISLEDLKREIHRRIDLAK
jgi:CheY-like chemotaxis protein